MPAKRLPTQVSKAFWCERDGRFAPAVIPRIGKARSKAQVSWFDQLFEGGLVLPQVSEDEGRALTVLLTGPPGSGKSTLALELCYRWATLCGVPEFQDGLDSLYITSESDAEWIKQKAASLGWENVGRTILGVRELTETPTIPLVTVLQTTGFREYLQDAKRLSRTVKALLDSLGSLYKVSGVGESAEEQLQKHAARTLQNKLHLRDPDVLVIDSLNTAASDNRPELFNKFLSLMRSGPRIIVVVLESNSPEQSSEFWEYVSDTVIRLDRKYTFDYMIRTIEVVKARYQPHIWGPQQLKIYPPTDVSDMKQEDKKRAHPYREEGGIFVFPSIHYYLSTYKRARPNLEPSPSETPLSQLNDAIQGGFPSGRCTGFVGVRGGHKSHLGYLHVLHRIVNRNERGLIISLRDDESMARKTLNRILKSELKAETRVENLEEDGRIEILYYPPGYITPEEFFHRMFLSVQRMKSGDADKRVNLLFNSLDQLSSRFPLCARERIFIPGIIETLSAERVTSIFIAVTEPGQPEEQYGLLSMADALLSFENEDLSREKYMSIVKKPWAKGLTEPELNEIECRMPPQRRIVSLKVIRFAGGQEAGAGGLLELIPRGTARFKLYRKEGLHFTRHATGGSAAECARMLDATDGSSGA